MRRWLGRMAAFCVCASALAGCGGAERASAVSPQDLANQIVSNDASLRAALDSWRAGGDPPASDAPDDVRAPAALLQGEIAYLAAHPSGASTVFGLLPGSLAYEVRQLYEARRDLIRLSQGTPNRKLKLGQRPPLSELVADYEEAERALGIDSAYLAAIHYVETKFGRVKNNSVAGAQGPMQFIPSTWKIYGRGGDIQDPRDAILAAARLLRANGAPGRYGPALRAYNQSGLYVDAVTRYARVMQRDRDALYFLYAWEPQ